MTKRRPDPDKVANELAGASAFFRRPAPAPPIPEPVAPAPAPAPFIPESPPQHDAVTSPRHDVTASQASEPVGFDLNRETASRDSLRLSIDETKALDALRSSLKWDHDLSVSKNDICRAALHWLVEDFTARGDKSQAVVRLRRKRASR